MSIIARIPAMYDIQWQWSNARVRTQQYRVASGHAEAAPWLGGRLKNWHVKECTSNHGKHDEMPDQVSDVFVCCFCCCCTRPPYLLALLSAILCFSRIESKKALDELGGPQRPITALAWRRDSQGLSKSSHALSLPAAHRDAQGDRRQLHLSRAPECNLQRLASSSTPIPHGQSPPRRDERSVRQEHLVLVNPARLIPLQLSVRSKRTHLQPGPRCARVACGRSAAQV